MSTNKKIELPEISGKNTKDQILAAYNQALEQLQTKQENITKTSIQKQEEVIVQEAIKISAIPLIEELNGVKIKMLKEVDVLADTLSKEIQKLTTIREAIRIEQDGLDELYHINKTAQTLDALLKAHKDEQEIFCQTMTEQTEEWQKKATLLEIEYKEKRDALEKSRQREEEEYTYNTEQARRKAHDAYVAEKAVWEKERIEQQAILIKREEIVAQQEHLLNELQIKVATFDQELTQQIKQAEAMLQKKLAQEHQFAIELAKKDTDAALRLAEQKILYLETKIHEQEQLVQQLTHKSDEASAQIQAIACRALDVSAQRIVHTVHATNNE